MVVCHKASYRMSTINLIFIPGAFGDQDVFTFFSELVKQTLQLEFPSLKQITTLYMHFNGDYEQSNINYLAKTFFQQHNSRLAGQNNIVIGYSYGGLIAVALASYLRLVQYTNSVIIMLDTPKGVYTTNREILNTLSYRLFIQSVKYKHNLPNLDISPIAKYIDQKSLCDFIEIVKQYVLQDIDYSNWDPLIHNNFIKDVRSYLVNISYATEYFAKPFSIDTSNLNLYLIAAEESCKTINIPKLGWENLCGYYIVATATHQDILSCKQYKLYLGKILQIIFRNVVGLNSLSIAAGEK